jgi:WD40 repeat protein
MKWYKGYLENVHNLYLESFVRGISSIAISADSQFLIYFTENGKLEIWDLKRRQKKASISNLECLITSISLSESNKSLLFGMQDGEVELWDANPLKKITTLGMHKGKILSTAFTENDKFGISSSADFNIFVWDIEQKMLKSVICEHINEVTALQTLKDNNFVSGGKDKCIILWDLDEIIEINRLKCETDINVLRTNKSKSLVIVCEDIIIRVLNADSLDEIQRFSEEDILTQGYSNFPIGAGISEDDELLYIVHTWTITTYDLKSSTRIRVDTCHSGSITRTGVACNNTYAVLLPDKYNSQNVIKIWNLAQNCEEFDLPGHATNISVLAQSPDSHYIIATAPDYAISIWNISTKTQDYFIKYKDYKLSCLVMSYDNKYVAAGFKTKNIRIWNVKKNKEKTHFQIDSGKVSCLAFDKQRKLLISGSSNSKCIIWNIKQRQAINQFTSHIGKIKSIAIENNYAVTSSDDNTWRIWQILDCKLMAWYKNQEKVKSLVFSFGMKYAVITNSKHYAKVYRFK